MENERLIVFTTCPNETCATQIARTLIERGLAACVNIAPGLRSVYGWEGKVISDNEWLLIIKAHRRRYTGIQTAICELHPHELPEIVAVPIATGLPEYLSWIDKCTNPSKQ